MPYSKQNFIDGQVLTAAHLNHIEDGIVQFTPVKGVDYFDGSPGADGVSPTVSVSKSGKVTTISITDKNGTKTATINDGADGSPGAAGTNGKDGKTPIKGTDYFTPAEQEDIVQRVLTELGAIPVFGMVDKDNNIILTAALANGIYQLKYADANGNMTDICTYEHNYVPDEPSGPVEIPLTWEIGALLDKNTGKVTQTNHTQYSASNYTEVNPNKTYTLSRDSYMYNSCNLIWYDANNNFISYFDLGFTSINASGGTSGLSIQLTPPANAAKFRLRLWYETTQNVATVAAYYKLIQN